MRYAIAIIVVLIAIGCKKDSTLLEPPRTLVISSQEDIDMYNAISQMDSLYNVVFDVNVDLDLSAFRNIKKLNSLYVKNCQQINAFENLLTVGVLTIQGLHEDCDDFEFSTLESVTQFLDISGNKDLNRFSFPRLKFIESLFISRNDVLESIADMRALEIVNRLNVRFSETLVSINGFQKCTSNDPFADYSLILNSYVDYGDAFEGLDIIPSLKFTAHQGANLDWVSNVKESDHLQFTGLIAPQELCGAIPLIKENAEVEVVLLSWIDNQFYGNDHLIDSCE